MERYNFQYCQKIVVFSSDLTSVLLCRRQDEKDLNGIFTFIGGKMEITDESILAGLLREKNEEVGAAFKINIFTKYSTNLFYIKKDGSRMILPHYFAIHKSGEIVLNSEYSEYRWVKIEDLNEFEPKIPNIPKTVSDMELLFKIEDLKDLIEI
jgi:NADH pyrophosphatase NudC (nudix superfamily)